MIRNKFLAVGITILLVGALVSAGIGTVGAEHSSSDYDEELMEGNTYWGGQTLAVDDANFDNETWDESTELEVRYSENDTLVTEFSTDSDGHYVYDTERDFERFGNGMYYLEGENGTYEFELVEQTLNAEFENASVQHDDNVTVELDSNRNGYELMVESSELTAEELAKIFDEASVETVDGDEEAVVSNVESRDELTAQFTEDDGTGTYNFTFSSVDANARSSDSVTVNEEGEPNGEFANRNTQVSVGNTLEFTVELDNTSDATVEFGGEDMSYSHSVDVVDNNEDGEVTVVFDASAAGDESEETFRSLEESEDTVSEGDNETETPGPIAKGSYNRTLVVNGEQTDAGVTTITSRTTSGVYTNALPYDWEEDENTTFDTTKPVSTVAEEDNVVVRVETTGLNGYMQNEDVSASDLNNGSSFADEYGFYVTVEEDNPPKNQEAKTIQPGEARYFEYSNEQVVLVFDTDEVNANAEEEYKVTAHFTEDYPYNDENDTYESFISVEERNVTIPDEYEAEPGADHDMVLPLPEDNNTQFELETNLAEDTEVVVQLLREGEDPFFERHTVTVEDGEMVVNPMGVNQSETGENVELTVETVNRTIDVRIVEERKGEATVNVDDGEQTTVVDSQYEAPFDVINTGDATMDVDVEYTFDGEVVRNETVTLEPDESYTVTQTLSDTGEFEQSVSVNGEEYDLPSVNVYSETENETVVTLEVEDNVTSGDEFNVTFTAEDVDEEETFEVSFNNETQTVTFEEDGSQNVTFTAPSEPGDYSVEASEDDELRASETMSVQQEQDTVNDDSAIVLVVVVLLFLAAGGAFLGVMMRRKDDNSPKRRL